MHRLSLLWLSLRRESGQALVEYGLILALVTLVGAVGIISMSGGVDSLYATVKKAADCMADPAACF